MSFLIKTISLAFYLGYFICRGEKLDRANRIQAKNIWDKNGFIVYCPCMGRFGNQADQFLGALAFAKGLNRTLVLPPWITYEHYTPGSQRTPFDTWFKVEPLKAYHRVITMEKFMANIAPSIWPKGTRIGFCYQFRGSDNECKMKEGNPFGPFWDHFGVDFDSYVEHKGLLYGTDFEPVKNDWNIRFQSLHYPVIALMGAPGDFPVLERNRKLQKYLQWSDEIEKISDEFIKNVLPEGPFVGIHLRTGSDWKNACNHIGPDTKQLFSSNQCTGYAAEYKLTKDMCWPSKKAIAKKTKAFVKQYKANSVFIATDSEPYTSVIENELKTLKWTVTIHQRKDSSRDGAIIDLAILTKSKVFIGNCVSSFSSFVKRTRDVQGKASGFWMFDPSRRAKDEL